MCSPRISGFHDHLVCHAVVKRVFREMKTGETSYPKRMLPFTRLGEVHTDGKFRLGASTGEIIVLIETCSDVDVQKFEVVPGCYESYQEAIEASNVKQVVTNRYSLDFLQRRSKKESRLQRKES